MALIGRHRCLAIGTCIQLAGYEKSTVPCHDGVHWHVLPESLRAIEVCIQLLGQTTSRVHPVGCSSEAISANLLRAAKREL